MQQAFARLRLCFVRLRQAFALRTEAIVLMREGFALPTESIAHSLIHIPLIYNGLFHPLHRIFQNLQTIFSSKNCT